MDEVREFRPYEHMYDGRDAGLVTAAFPKRRRSNVKTGARALAPAEDAWFYRYDRKHVEVRDVAGCRDKVFASIHVSKLQEEDGEELNIVRVVHTTVNDERVLLIAATDKQTAECRFVLFNPFTLATTVLSLSITVMGMITSMAVSEPYALTEADIQSVRSHGPTEPRFYNLLVVGMADSTVHVNKLFSYEDKTVVESIIIPLSKAYGTISALDTHSVILDDDDESSSSSSVSRLGTAPVVVVGTSSGRVEAYRIQRPKERREKDHQNVMIINTLESKAPVTKLEIIPMTDANEIVLLVGQGTVSSTMRSDDRPSVSMYQVRLLAVAAANNYKLLGRVAATVVPTEVIEGGQTLATALLDDEEKFHLIVVFSLRTQSRTRIELGAWSMRAGDGQLDEIRREDVSSFGSEALQDVVPRRQSLECFLLYPNKAVVFTGFLDSSEIDDEDDGLMEDIVEYPKFDDWIDEELDEFPYTPQVLKQIKDRRKKMADELFVDKLLTFAGVEVDALYPPKNISDMQRLWQIIFGCDLDVLKKYCIIYYFLKDLDKDKPDAFAARYLIPNNYLRLIDGYWAIDHWEFADALRHLAYPTVDADWSSKIVEVLYRYAGARVAARFLNIARPALWNPAEVELQMDVDVQCDVVEAFLFQRQHDVYGEDHRRERLLKKLFDHCFSVKENKSSNINRLLSLPLDGEEEAFMIKYCLQSSHPFCKDFLIMYYVHHGRYIEAIKLNDQLRAQEGPHSGSGGKGGINRNAIIENLKLLLPEVQRNMLDLESERMVDLSAPAVLTRESSKDTVGDVQMIDSTPMFSDDISTSESQEADEVLVQRPQASTWNLVESTVVTGTTTAENIPPLSASSIIRRYLPEIDAKDVAPNAQKAIMKALRQQMVRLREDFSEPSLAPSPTANINPVLISSMTAQNPSSASSVNQSHEKLAQEIVVPVSPFVGPPATPKDDTIDRLRDQQNLPALHSPLTPNNAKDRDAFFIHNLPSTGRSGAPAPSSGDTPLARSFGQSDAAPKLYGRASPTPRLPSASAATGGPILTSMSPFSPKKLKQTGKTRNKYESNNSNQVGSNFQLAGSGVRSSRRSVKKLDPQYVRSVRVETDQDMETDGQDGDQSALSTTTFERNRNSEEGAPVDTTSVAQSDDIAMGDGAGGLGTSRRMTTTMSTTMPRRSERKSRSARSTLNVARSTFSVEGSVDSNLNTTPAQNTRRRAQYLEETSSAGTQNLQSVLTNKTPKRKTPGASRAKSLQQAEMEEDEPMSPSEVVVGPPGRTPGARRRTASVLPVNALTTTGSLRPNRKVRAQPTPSTPIGRRSRKGTTTDDGSQ